jgi:hypothetical protein
MGVMVAQVQHLQSQEPQSHALAVAAAGQSLLLQEAQVVQAAAVKGASLGGLLAWRGQLIQAAEAAAGAITTL